MALRLAGERIGDPQVVLGDLADPGEKVGVVGKVERTRLLGGFLGKLDDGFDHRLEAFVTEHHRAEHDFLGELAGLRFDHQHRIGGAGDDEVELRLLHRVDQRVEDVFAADITDARAADRSHEGDAGEGERGGGGDHRHDVRVILEIVRQHGGDDLGLAAEAFGKERPDRPVDQARDEGLVLARTAFALEIAAGDLSGGEGLLLVVDGERKEVDAHPLLPGGDDRGEHRGLAIGGDDRAIGLAGNLAGFKNQGPAAPIDLDTLDVEHGSSFQNCGQTG